MIQNLYAAKDNVRGVYFTTFLATTDGQAVRDNMPAFWRVFPKSDVSLWNLGAFEDLTGKFEPSAPKQVDVDNAYKFPEVKAQNLSDGNPTHDMQKMRDLTAGIDGSGEENRASLDMNPEMAVMPKDKE